LCAVGGCSIHAWLTYQNVNTQIKEEFGEKLRVILEIPLIARDRFRGVSARYQQNETEVT